MTVARALGFGALSDEVEALLARELALEPIADELVLAGSLRGEPVSLRTRRLAGPRIRHARVARLDGPGLQIANLLYLPALELRAPVFAADLVGWSPTAGLLVADVSPIADAPAETVTCALPSAGPLPAWAASIFSPSPLFARVEPSGSVEAARALLELAGRFARALQRAPAGDERAFRAAQERYLRVHREDDRALGLLAKIFGGEPAARYVREVLFPEPEPAASRA